MSQEIVLTPTQRIAADGLREALKSGGTLILRGGPGAGKTTVLQWLHAACGGNAGLRAEVASLLAYDSRKPTEAVEGWLQSPLVRGPELAPAGDRSGPPALTLPQQITLAGDVHIRCYARVLRVEPHNGLRGVAARIERYEFLPASA